MAPVQVGQLVDGKYEVERILAQGGIGLVVKARDLETHEPCALKLLLPEALESPMARARFLREARACAKVESDYVVEILDVGETEEGMPYLVLEYLDGIDLEARMEAGALPPGEAALYTLQLCAALAEAHVRGIVHRDIKPGNVFLARQPDGTIRVKLLDFGISKLLDDAGGNEQARTMEGTVMGTPSCMAPEQARGDPVDARTDVWAVGILLYHLVTGVFPFDDPVPYRCLEKILRDAPVPPSQYAPTLPPELERIILRCLEKDPSRRPAVVEEVATALTPFATAEAPRITMRVSRVFDSLAEVRASLLPRPPSEPAPPDPDAAASGPASSAAPLPADVAAGIAPPTSGGEPSPAPLVIAIRAPSLVTIAPAALPPSSARASSPWKLAAAAVGLLLAAAAGVALAPRAPDGATSVPDPRPSEPAPTPRPAASAVQVPAKATAVVSASASADPPAQAPPATSAPAPASASAAPRVPLKPVTPRPVLEASPGFDIGSRR